jgi:hypothetical protein
MLAMKAQIYDRSTSQQRRAGCPRRQLAGCHLGLARAMLSSSGQGCADAPGAGELAD